MRICSLLPSATEIVFALGLGDQLVAVTHECDYPPEASSVPAITESLIDHDGSSSGEIHNHISSAVHSGSGIYRIDEKLLKELDPDLVLTQELCEVCAVSYEDVKEAARVLDGDRKIVSLEPKSLDGIVQTVEDVGRLTGSTAEAERVASRLRDRIHTVEETADKASTRPTVLGLEWLDPPFIGGHWVPEMIRLAGGRDGLGREGRPSSQVPWSAVSEYDAQINVLMVCGFDLHRTVEEFRRVRDRAPWPSLTGETYAVDGSAYFSRPGPRIVEGLEVLAEIVHPELFPRTKPTNAWTRIP